MALSWESRRQISRHFNDIALSPSLLKAVFSRELRHAVAVERGQIPPRELAPLRPDLREDDLLGLGGGFGFYRSRIGSHIVM
jgi:hypothetical protein